MELMVRRGDKVFNKFTTAAQGSSLSRPILYSLFTGKSLCHFYYRTVRRTMATNAGHRVISSITGNRRRTNERFTARHRMGAFKAESTVGRVEFHTIRLRGALGAGAQRKLFFYPACVRRRSPQKGNTDASAKYSVPARFYLTADLEAGQKYVLSKPLGKEIVAIEVRYKARQM